jgi:hypothetical protein
MTNREYFERLARKRSLNSAIIQTIVSTLYGSTGIFQIIKYGQHQDPFYLWVGPFNLVLGSFLVFRGVQLIHSVVRRMVAEQQSGGPSTDSSRK